MRQTSAWSASRINDPSGNVVIEWLLQTQVEPLFVSKWKQASTFDRLSIPRSSPANAVRCLLSEKSAVGKVSRNAFAAAWRVLVLLCHFSTNTLKLLMNLQFA